MVESPQEAKEHVDALSAVLIDCVEGGASVSFMSPLTRERADAFWRGVAEGVAEGERILLVAQDDTSGQIVGTGGNLIGNALLDGSTLLDAAAIAAAQNGDALPAAPTTSTSQSGVAPVGGANGTLPSPTTR